MIVGSYSPITRKQEARVQTHFQSLVEVVVGRAGSLFIGATFSLWWIPEEAPTFLLALWKTWPYIFLAIVWGYFIRRAFNR